MKKNYSDLKKFLCAAGESVNLIRETCKIVSLNLIIQVQETDAKGEWKTRSFENITLDIILAAREEFERH